MRLLSRRKFIAGSAGAIAAAGTGLFADTRSLGAPSAPLAYEILPPVSLRGYGAVSAAFRIVNIDGGNGSLTHITCESLGKALLLQSKFLSDLYVLPGATPAQVMLDLRVIDITSVPPGTFIACFSEGKQVLVLVAPSKQALASMISAHTPAFASASSFRSRANVPMYLDRFDKYGLLIYYGPWTTPTRAAYDFNQDFQFVKDNDTGFVIWHRPLNSDAAEGLTDDKWWDWVQSACKTQGIPVHINLENSFPLWLGNRYRDETMLRAPQFTGGYYGIASDTTGEPAISWCSQIAKDCLLGVLQESVRRFVDDPNVVGWLEPHNETSEYPQQLLIDYGPVADDSLRRYLKSRFSDLHTLSMRWYGDATFLKDWTDIKAPEPADFVGISSEAIDLRGTWRVKHFAASGSSVPPDWIKPDFDDSSWDEMLAPGNDRVLSMRQYGAAAYRRTIDVPTGWKAAHEKVWLYFWVLFGPQAVENEVYVNGTKVQRDANFKFAFEVSSALKSGSNFIVLVPSSGIICYRTYLSPEPPLQYPYLGPQKNARWVDCRKWQSWCVASNVARGVEMIRQIDPNRPINLMSPDMNAGAIKSATEIYGGHFHNTGYAAGFWAEYHPLLMRGSGLPSTAEPGNGAHDVPSFLAFFGRWLTEGLNGIHYFQNLGEITWNPDILAVFLKNRRMYEMIGKYHVPGAALAILFSTTNELLGGFPWGPDQPGYIEGGYWRFNPATALINYCARDGVSAEDFQTENVGKYRMIIDSNSMVADDDLIDGIERYVRAGGVFVALGQTGRHSEVVVDSWPISKLTGYDCSEVLDWGKGASFSKASGQPIYDESTYSLPARASGLRLKANSADCIDILRWQDGGVAAGMRKLGAGWIVTFSLPVGGNDVLTALVPIIEHFGAANRVPIVLSNGGLHARHYISNSGLHDIWAVFNDSASPQTTDLKILPGYSPSRLTDVVTGNDERIVTDGSGDSVTGVSLDSFETRMWISPRKETASAPLEWLKLQRSWWRGTQTPGNVQLPSAKDDQKFMVDLSSRWSFKPADALTDEQAAALGEPQVDSSSWEVRDLDIWTIDHPNVKRAVLRRNFAIPSHWQGGEIGLCLDRWQRIFTEEARVFLDGQAIHKQFSGSGFYMDPLGGVLAPGTTHTLTLDVQSHSFEAGVVVDAWVSWLPESAETQDLTGQWSLFDDALKLSGSGPLPGPFKGQYASRTVTVDSRHNGRNVMILIVGQNANGVLINGKLTHRSSVIPINVTPFIRFGEDNLIEISARPSAAPVSINKIELRYYDKDVYP